MDSKAERQAVDESYADHQPHLTTLTAPPPTTTSTMMDLTSYSQAAAAVTSYSLDLHPSSHHPTSYYAEYDWQHASSATPVTDPAAAAAHGPAAAFYGFPEARADLALYHHNFPSAVQHAADLYSASPALWPHGAPTTLVEDPGQLNAALSSQRFLPSRASVSSTSSSSATSPSGATTGSGKPKRRRVQSVTQRKAANVRERRRMFHLNTAFDELRKRLPAFNYEKRLSRIETLRLAMTYIGFMKDVAMGEDPRNVKLRPSCRSDAGSDLSHVDMESCASDDLNQDDMDS